MLSPLAQTLRNKINGLKTGGMEIVRIELDTTDAFELREDNGYILSPQNVSIALFDGVRVEIFQGDYFEPVVVWRHRLNGQLLWCSIYTGKQVDDGDSYPYDDSDTDEAEDCSNPAPAVFDLTIPGLINIHVDLPGL